jgi:glycopeptide antibiotics resistance protein
MRRRNSVSLVLIYLGYVLVATLYPFKFTGVHWDSVRQSLSGFFVFSSPKDFILNVVLFIPLGVLLYRRLCAARNKLSAIAIAALVAAGTSLAIEILQSVFQRQPEAFDVLANALGAGAGAMTAAFWPNRFAAIVAGYGKRLEWAGMVVAMTLLFGAVPFVLSIVQFIAPFGVWNARFSFLLGNEATLDRPWLGRVHFVAVYNRALSAEEIHGRYSRGPAGMGSPEGLVSLYTFCEGEGHIVHDRSGVEPTLDLSVEPADGVRWLEAANGVEFVRPAVLRSREPARKLAAGSRATGELGIEAWVTPRDDNQRGPARIVSFSRSPIARNFTLAQEGSKIDFRLRTPLTGRNGALLTLTTSDILESLEIVHLVATYKDGVERLYVNGRAQPPALDLPNEIIVGFGTGRTLMAEAAYAFFYFFPAAFFSARFFAAQSRGFARATLLPAAIASLPLLAAELFQVYAFHRAVDISLIGVGLLVAALGAIGGE